MAKETDIRPSPIAGLWYAGNPQRLAQEVDEFIEKAKLPELQGEVVALFSPHAGHRYSGRTAGYAFRAVKGLQFDLAAVVSPLHSYYPAPLLTSAHRAYTTPLGEVEIDRQAVEEVDQALHGEAGLRLAPVAHDQEHSLEIELPFLQRALVSGFKLLPVMVRSQVAVVAQQLGKALAEVLKKRNALLVASTDLSHFYAEPIANTLDEEMLRQIAEFSPEGVLEAERSGKGFACGHAAMAAVLWAARELGADTVRVLRHATSGDVSGDYNGVVGYAAAVVLTSHSP